MTVMRKIEARTMLAFGVPPRRKKSQILEFVKLLFCHMIALFEKKTRVRLLLLREDEREQRERREAEIMRGRALFVVPRAPY